MIWTVRTHSGKLLGTLEGSDNITIALERARLRTWHEVTVDDGPPVPKHKAVVRYLNEEPKEG